MRSRKVYKVLAHLSEEQRKDFHAYLASPYLNTNGRLLRFMEILESEVFETERDVSPEEIWAKGLSQGPYRANGFDKICAELLAAFNSFLGLETYMKRPESVVGDAFEGYVDGGMDEWIPGMFRAISAKHGPAFSQSSEGLHAHMRLLRNYSVHLFRQPRAPRGEWLIDIDNALTHFFLAQKLELAAALSNYNQVFNSEIELPDEAWLVERLEASFDALPLYIRLHYLGYLTAKGSEAHFLRLKAELAKHREDLPPDEGKHLYRLALNFCYFRLNQGEQRFEEEAEGLMLELLEANWLLQDGRMPPEHFKNIVSVRLRQGATEWVKGFIEEWENQLTDDHAGAACTYNRALLAFYERKYGDCIRGMEEVLRDFKADVYYGLDARLYQIKSLYERNGPDDFMELESRLNAFRVFVLRSKKVSEIEHGHYKNFVKECRRLVRIRDEIGGDREEKIEKFLSGLSGGQTRANQKWFEQMVAKLRGT